MGPLAALCKAHDQIVERTHALPYLGLPTARRGEFDRSLLPAPDLQEPNTRTKFPHVFCVTLGGELIQLLCPMSPDKGGRLAHDLIKKGLHPLDIIVGTVDVKRFLDGDEEGAWTIRQGQDHLFWTYRDQMALERELASAQEADSP